jgi:hypothetical protein
MPCAFFWGILVLPFMRGELLETWAQKGKKQIFLPHRGLCNIVKKERQKYLFLG